MGASAEIDAANAADAGLQLCAAFAPGVSIVTADLTQTVLCNSSGVAQLVLAYHCAAAHDAQLQLAVPTRTCWRVLKLTGPDGLLPACPSLDAALSAGPWPTAVASRG